MVPAERARWHQALKSVAKVERRSRLLRGGRRRNKWTIHGRTAVRNSSDVEQLPAVIRPRSRVTDEISASAAADVVKIGKFDVDRAVRLRAFYEPAGVSVRLQMGRGISRTLRAFSHVDRHAPGLMPQVHDDGRLGRANYLLEESLFGTHPRAGQQLQDVAEELGSGLRRLHDGYGVADVSLSKVLGQKFDMRWRSAALRYDIPKELDRRVRALVAEDKLVEVSFGHGDLVGTNIMTLSGGRLVLIDWEYSGVVPIAFDVAKVHLHCAVPSEATQILREALGRPARESRSHYSFVQQIALAHIRYIAWSGDAMERAKVANRVKQLNRLNSMRLRSIEQALDGA